MPMPSMLNRSAADLDTSMANGDGSQVVAKAAARVSPRVPGEEASAAQGGIAKGRDDKAARGRASRRKGARGQAEFADMLRDRDWSVDQITAGIAAADLIATDPDGRTYAVEVKHCASILPAHRKQAMEQGDKRRLPWLLASKIAGTSSWLVQRTGSAPVVWSAKEIPASTTWQGLGGDRI
jgi:hypothetical protein